MRNNNNELGMDFSTMGQIIDKCSSNANLK